MLEISPKGTVPVLVLKTGQVIDQSLDIINYALEQNEQFNIQNYTLAKRKDIQELIANNDIEFTKLLRIYKYPERYPDDSQELSRRQI